MVALVVAAIIGLLAAVLFVRNGRSSANSKAASKPAAASTSNAGGSNGVELVGATKAKAS